MKTTININTSWHSWHYYTTVSSEQAFWLDKRHFPSDDIQKTSPRFLTSCITPCHGCCNHFTSKPSDAASKTDIVVQQGAAAAAGSHVSVWSQCVMLSCVLPCVRDGVRLLGDMIGSYTRTAVKPNQSQLPTEDPSMQSNWKQNKEVISNNFHTNWTTWGLIKMNGKHCVF